MSNKFEINLLFSHFPLKAHNAYQHSNGVECGIELKQNKTKQTTLHFEVNLDLNFGHTPMCHNSFDYKIGMILLFLTPW